MLGDKKTNCPRWYRLEKYNLLRGQLVFYPDGGIVRRPYCTPPSCPDTKNPGLDPSQRFRAGVFLYCIQYGIVNISGMYDLISHTL